MGLREVGVAWARAGVRERWPLSYYSGWGERERETHRKCLVCVHTCHTVVLVGTLFGCDLPSQTTRTAYSGTAPFFNRYKPSHLRYSISCIS